MTDYPTNRPAMWAMRLIQALASSGAVHEIGATGVWLVTLVALAEDQTRYRRPVAFTNGTILDRIGLRKLHTLCELRKRCIDAGWLRYEPRGTQQAGLYWSDIPSGSDGLMPICGTNAGSNRGTKTDINDGIKHGTNTGNTSFPIPIPKPDDDETPVIITPIDLDQFKDLDPNAMERLAPIVAAGIELQAKPTTLSQWIRNTDRLTPDEVRAVLDLRRGPICWPSEFMTLRQRWQAAVDKIEARVTAERERQTSAAQEVAAQATERASQARRQAQATAEALARREALATALGASWGPILAKVGQVDGAGIWLGNRGVWPVSLEDGVLTLHVPSGLFTASIHDRLAIHLISAASAVLGREVSEVRCQVNGYHHQALASVGGSDA